MAESPEALEEPKPPRDSGWAPYWAPMLAFLLTVELGGRLPDGLAPLVFVTKVGAPLALFVYFLRRGRYPELFGADWSGGRWLADVGVGLLGAALWVAPYILWDGLRPDLEGFDPAQLGAEGVGFVLLVRAVGYAGVTPFVEELFVRSWMIRYVEVFDRRGDFRKLPVSRFTWRSFIVVTVYFVFSHQQWEWGVMLTWTLLTMAWFYRRGHLAPLVLVHAVTNAAIFAFAVGWDGRFTDAAGKPISLLFFL